MGGRHRLPSYQLALAAVRRCPGYRLSRFAASIDSYHANRFSLILDVGVQPLIDGLFGFLFGRVFRDDTIGRPEPPAAACDFFDYRRALAYDFDTKLL